MVTKQFYIAGSFRQIQLINDVSIQLENAGFTRTYDWAKRVGATNLADLREIAQAEYTGITTCDFFVFVFPGGKGSNIEFGIATALHKPIYILDTVDQINNPAGTSTFYLMDHVQTFHGATDEFKNFVLKHEQ
ncbi:nucleoside 2-deoxyribosyltransferase [Levilactobacillus fujinensis]|uniref:Nucleoside 2-deoxyribosyltransferase n=1 Tax=Levilactobacillus fujinensis TaxID=2486024 RepID=A0ABW1TI53_9LACO|nr:nucleoside 2-deoxyribosyltransferase [Levilactobacillus fujinensis]